MDRIRKALDRARLERALTQRAGFETADAPLSEGDHPEPRPREAEDLSAEGDVTGGDHFDGTLAAPTPIPTPTPTPTQAEPEPTHTNADSEARAGVEAEGEEEEEAEADADADAGAGAGAGAADRQQTLEIPQTEIFTLDRSSAPASSRLSGYTPLLVSVVLGILITVELARASLLLLERSPSKAQEPAQLLGARLPPRPAIDANRIAAAHLFGEAAKEPRSEDPAILRRSRANLLLAGTLAMSDPSDGFAIINDRGKATAYRVGDTVADSELQSVYRDHVVLKRGGSMETLLFPRFETPSTAASVANTNVAAQRLGGQPTAGDLVRGRPFASPNGRLQGFRIYPAKDLQLFNASGLHAGDIVVAVNGASLEDQDPRTGQQIFDSLKTASQATVTVVDHAGARHDVTIDPAQAVPADPANPVDQ